MKTFKQFMAEAVITVPDALKIMGFQAVPSSEVLKTSYKKLAVKYHPDKPGGDLVTMQKVNAAYDLLQKVTSGGGLTNGKEKEEYDERARIYQSLALRALQEKFHPLEFVNHFNRIFGDTFTYVITTSDITKKWRVSNVWLDCEFSNSDKSTTFDIHVTADWTKLFDTPALAAENLGFPMYIATTIYHNRRKIKLTNSNYRFDKDYRVLSDPETLFPTDKLGAKKSTEKNRKMSKRDVILAFEKELGGDWDTRGWIYIPLYGDFKLVMYRTTLMGAASWHINGLYKGHTKVSVLPAISSYFIETTSCMEWLIDSLRDVKHSAHSQEAIEADLRKIADYFAAHRTEFYAEIDDKPRRRF